MNPLKQYCKYLNDQDADGLMSLFAEVFVFDDRGGQDIGSPPFIRTDKPTLKASMEGVFQQFSKAEWNVELIDTAYGNGVMIHCGDPIKYASINTSYWQSHFYAFGRISGN